MFQHESSDDSDDDSRIFEGLNDDSDADHDGQYTHPGDQNFDYDGPDTTKHPFNAIPPPPYVPAPSVCGNTDLGIFPQRTANGL